MLKLYLENIIIVWNGNVVKGGSVKVMDFFNNFLVMEYMFYLLDC